MYLWVLTAFSPPPDVIQNLFFESKFRAIFGLGTYWRNIDEAIEFSTLVVLNSQHSCSSVNMVVRTCIDEVVRALTRSYLRVSTRSLVRHQSLMYIDKVVLTSTWSFGCWPRWFNYHLKSRSYEMCLFTFFDEIHSSDDTPYGFRHNILMKISAGYDIKFKLSDYWQ